MHLISSLRLALITALALLSTSTGLAQVQMPLPVVQDAKQNAELMAKSYRGMCEGDHLRPDFKAKLAVLPPGQGPTDDVCRSMKALLEKDDLVFLESMTRFEQERRHITSADMPVEYALMSLLKSDPASARPFILSMAREYQIPGLWTSPLPGLSDLLGSRNDDGFASTAPSLATFYQFRIEPESDEIARNALQLILAQKTQGIKQSLSRIREIEVAHNERMSAQLAELKRAYARVSDLWASATLRHVPLPEQNMSREEFAIRDLEQALSSSSLNATSADPGIADIENALGDKDVLVEFAEVWLPVYQPHKRPTVDIDAQAQNIHYVAYVLRHAERIVSFDLGNAIDIDRAVGEYLGVVKQRPERSAQEQRSKQLRGASHEVYTLVWKPLSDLLEPTRQSGGHIYLAPDGDLTLLPFDALVADDGEYLLSRWKLSYLTSGRQLLSMRERHTEWVAGIGDGHDISVFTYPVETGKGVLAEFRALPYAQQELWAISGIFPGTVTGASTEGHLKELRGPRILHLATHGYFINPPELNAPPMRGKVLTRKAPFRLLRSGVVLAPTTGVPGEDGIVTALEVALLDLHKTDLVVLSACDSGLGDATPGDSVGGLRNAFHIAGAKSVVSSLWTIQDSEAPLMMQRFYELLSQGATVDNALQEAKMWGLQHYSDPYFWGSFILEGDSRLSFR